MKNEPFLTQKQEKVLNFIRKRIGERLPPTIREIGEEMGFKSTGTVRDYLMALQKKGFLRRSDNLSRAIELTGSIKAGIPILASIAAGRPNFTYEDIEGYVDPDDLFLGRASLDDVFALKVKGESMIEAGIMDGDIAIIKKQPHAEDGAIIAAMTEDNEATLKRFKLKGSRPYLEAANSKFPPLHLKFTVIGKVLTVIRKYA